MWSIYFRFYKKYEKEYVIYIYYRERHIMIYNNLFS